MSEVAAEIWSAINELRSGEGDSVEIHCDNPDFNGLPNCAIGVTAYWTDWTPRQFRADTVLDCLHAALTERSAELARKGAE